MDQTMILSTLQTNKDVSRKMEEVKVCRQAEHRSYGGCQRCTVPALAAPFKVDVDVSSSSHFAALSPRRQRDEATCNREAEALHANSSTTLM